jgi:hypothetical protein
MVSLLDVWFVRTELIRVFVATAAADQKDLKLDTDELGSAHVAAPLDGTADAPNASFPFNGCFVSSCFSRFHEPALADFSVTGDFPLKHAISDNKTSK